VCIVPELLCSISFSCTLCYAAVPTGHIPGLLPHMSAPVKQGSHASWKVLDVFLEHSRAWKVLENYFGHGKSWK